MSDDEIIARKLFNDGDGIGDERRLNHVLKSFLKWCDTDYKNSTENVIAKEKISTHLNLCEHAMKKSKAVTERINEEILMFDNISKEIDTKIKNIHADIDETKVELRKVETRKQNQMEYDLFTKNINKYPSRAETAKYLNELNNEVQVLNVSKTEINESTHKIQKPLNIIISSINSITECLDENIENSSLLKENMSSYEPIDDDEDLEILNRKDDFK